MSEEKAIKKTDMFKVRLDVIEIEEGFNPREDYGDLDVLARQIAAQGQKQPLRGRIKDGKFIPTSGHRRNKAIRIANEKYIGKPGYLQEKIEYVLVMTSIQTEEERLLEALTDGDGVKPLTNREMVNGIKRLIEMGVAQKDIVKSLGMNKSQAQIYNLVAAAKTPKAVQKMIDEGLISVAKVNALQRKSETADELVEMAQDFIDNGSKPEKKVTDLAKLEEVLDLIDPTTSKGAFLKALVNKLKAKAPVEEIAKLLK